MSRSFHPRPTYANVAATVALVLALTTGAFAAASSIPGPDGVIHGCYQKQKGNLRLVSAGKKCLRSESGITWNQQGLQGAKGNTGATGAQGQQGPQGSQGPAEPFPTGPLPSGATVRGTYQVQGVLTTTSDRLLSSISFVYAMPAQLTQKVLAPGASPTAACPGTADHPEAARGNLCVYRQSLLEANVSGIELYTPTGGGDFTKTGFTGEIVDVAAAAANTDTQAGGTWAATAP
jgi:hypothetical protein